MSATNTAGGNIFFNTGFQNINTGGGSQFNQTGPDEQTNQHRQCLSYMQQSGYVPAHQKANAEKRKEQLFEPACEWIFENPEFQQWLDGADPPGFWLHGGPGKGKTKLLCSVLNHLLGSAGGALVSSDPGLLVTYSFFSDPDGDREASFVVATLIHGLAQQQPSYLRRISEAYDHESKYPFQGKRPFQALADILKDMLEDNPTRTGIILVVDALDECQADTDLDQLLDLILETSSIQNVRWFVSSRRLPAIHQKFDAPDANIRKLSLDQTGEDIQEAVQAYIHHRMGSLHLLRMSEEKKEELQNRLLRKAGGTFLWLSIVMTELKKGNSWNIDRVVESLSVDLKSLYESLLQNLLGNLASGGDIEVDKEVFHKTLATTTTALRPLYIEELKELAGFPAEIDHIGQVEEVIDKCGAFLTCQNNQVFLIHLSAKEFLTPEKLQSAFQSDPLDIHSHLFSRSMSVMEENLKRDIYNLEKPGIDIREIDLTPSPDPLSGLKYSCNHWIDHLEHVQFQNRSHYQAMRLFIEKSLLHWLEAMSLQRKMREAIWAVEKLRSLMVLRYASDLQSNL
ncbi:NACHT domain-containing protein [Fusarium keratoplasticum]|nr:NACHT domain-containing protein [Fusarium keratoplasticum]